MLLFTAVATATEATMRKPAENAFGRPEIIPIVRTVPQSTNRGA
jgi:hypothetical protein